MRKIYADNAATTKISEAALEKLNNCILENYGNIKELSNEEKINKLKENVELYNILIEEFGTIENIPNFLISLPL